MVRSPARQPAHRGGAVPSRSSQPSPRSQPRSVPGPILPRWWTRFPLSPSTFATDPTPSQPPHLGVHCPAGSPAARTPQSCHLSRTSQTTQPHPIGNHLAPPPVKSRVTPDSFGRTQRNRLPTVEYDEIEHGGLPANCNSPVPQNDSRADNSPPLTMPRELHMPYALHRRPTLHVTRRIAVSRG